MDTFLTTRQVQELLKVDRITIYRMLDDGRLKGVKIGQQWRFASSDVERLLAGDCCESEPDVEIGSSQGFPVHCIQALQDVFAEIGQVSALTLNAQGQVLTEISNPCAFCQMVQSRVEGLQACHASWAALGGQNGEGGYHTCHAGLQMAWAPVRVENATMAYLVAGPVWTDTTALPRLEKMAAQFDLEPGELIEAALRIPQVDAVRKAEIQDWPRKVARSMESILLERTRLVSRLQRISELSNI